MTPVGLALVVVVGGAPALLAGCAPAPRVCSAVSPTCPTDAPPMYAADVEPLIQMHCAGCHFPGSTLAPVDLTTYAAVRARRSTIYTELASCNMPPLSEPAMTDAERLTILDWMVCGSLDD